MSNEVKTATLPNTALAAALTAANVGKPVEPTKVNPVIPPTVASKPENGPSKPGDAPKPNAPTVTPPTGDKPTGDATKGTATVPPQGGKPVDQPNAKTQTGGKAKGKGKPEPDTKPQGKVDGFDAKADYPNLGSWPSWCGPAPTGAHVIAALTMVGSRSRGSKKVLAHAKYLMTDGGKYHVHDIGYAVAEVCGGNHNNNLSNVALDAAREGWCILLRTSAAESNPNHTGGTGRQRTGYHAVFFTLDANGKPVTPAGHKPVSPDKRKLVYAAIKAAGLKVPVELRHPSDEGKGYW